MAMGMLFRPSPSANLAGVEEEDLSERPEGRPLVIGRSVMFAGSSGVRARFDNAAATIKRNVIHPLRRIFHFVLLLPPPRLVLLGYASYIIAGWVLLCLPFAQRQGGGNALDHLFIATSAVSTTGLTTISVADSYTFFGQFVVLLLIQLGGIGYMTIGSFVILSRSESLPRLRENVGRFVFALPESFRLDKFVRSVVTFTLAIEGLGVLALYPLFRNAGVDAPFWNALFHSVSAFCTAGFGLFNNSFESYAGHFWMNVVLGALSYLGAVGFIVCVDAWRMLTRKVRHMTLTSRIILWMTFWLSVGGTAVLFLVEPSIRGLPPHERLMTAAFQCMTAMTTVGFNTVPIAGLSKAAVLTLIVLMVIGASPSGTGGGVKSTSVSVLLGFMSAAVRGRTEVTFWGRPIPQARVVAAIANIGFYALSLLMGAFFLDLLEPAPFDQCFFEAASALGTVGLSMGITAGLSSLGKVLVVAMMYAGRVGPLTLAIALFAPPPATPGDGDRDVAV